MEALNRLHEQSAMLHGTSQKPRHSEQFSKFITKGCSIKIGSFSSNSAVGIQELAENIIPKNASVATSMMKPEATLISILLPELRGKFSLWLLNDLFAVLAKKAFRHKVKHKPATAHSSVTYGTVGAYRLSCSIFFSQRSSAFLKYVTSSFV